jgi:UDP-N-acetylmuramyl tripeptide synthase
MLAAILRESGHSVTHNRAGANVPAGIVTALLEEPGDYGVFEVDEAWLPVIAAELNPDLLVLGNLFRDRLDGYGELDALAAAWEAMIGGRLAARLVLNADDPTVAALGAAGGGGGGQVASYFGVEDRAVALPEPEHAVDAVRCRGCDGRLRFEARMLSHMGHHRCDSCGAERPLPRVAAEEILIDGLSGSRFSIKVDGERLAVRLGVPGLYNVYNALAAAAAANTFGIGAGPIASALASFEPVFGRGERIRAGSTDLTVLLMKNPAGANELLRTLGRNCAPPLDLLIALNDGNADGRDVSWIWDADFEALRSVVGHVVCSGRRAAELALRLKYAEWPLSRLEVEPEMPAALDLAIEKSGDRLVALPTYSALLELHAELAARGLVRPFWAGPAVPVGGQAA